MRSSTFAALFLFVACQPREAPSTATPSDPSTAPLGDEPVATATQAEPLELPADATWVELPAPKIEGKQDDVFFIDERTGWYANGKGQIFATRDGGDSWTETLTKPGTYWRTLGFVDDNVGFFGNIGTEYFPGVTDPVPLYRTSDGGKTVEVVDLEGPPIKGLCAIDVLESQFINRGVLQKRTLVHAAGRVGGPAWLVRSLDGGKRWKTIDLNDQIAMVTDVKFLSESVGYIAGGSSSNIANSRAVVLKTIDGGESWTPVYTSSRPFETGWKFSFPTETDGFATVQNHDPNIARQVVARTRDGGATWDEVALVDDAAAREFGIGFISPTTGWVGTAKGGFQTTDGGDSWTPVNMGSFVNKIRILPTERGFLAFAIGSGVYRLDGRRNMMRSRT